MKELVFMNEVTFVFLNQALESFKQTQLFWGASTIYIPVLGEPVHTLEMPGNPESHIRGSLGFDLVTVNLTGRLALYRLRSLINYPEEYNLTFLLRSHISTCRELQVSPSRGVTAAGNFPVFTNRGTSAAMSRYLFHFLHASPRRRLQGSCRISNPDLVD